MVLLKSGNDRSNCIDPLGLPSIKSVGRITGIEELITSEGGSPLRIESYLHTSYMTANATLSGGPIGFDSYTDADQIVL